MQAKTEQVSVRLKACVMCGVAFPRTHEFFYYNGPRKDRGDKKFLRPYCKPCDIEDRRVRYFARKERDPKGHALKVRKAAVKNKYGLTVDQANELLAAQGFKRPICLRELRVFGYRGAHIDHCHRTGRVRGILCWVCNKAIGVFHEDPAVFQRASDYVRTARTPYGKKPKIKRPSLVR